MQARVGGSTGYSVSRFVVAGPGGAGAVSFVAGLAEASYIKTMNVLELRAGDQLGVAAVFRQQFLVGAGFRDAAVL